MAREAHAPCYTVICGLSDSAVYFHTTSKMALEIGKFLNIKRVLIFSTTFVCIIPHSKKNRERCDQIYM